MNIAHIKMFFAKLPLNTKLTLVGLLCLLTYAAYCLEQYQVQQMQHQMRIHLLKATLFEHRFFVQHGHYTQEMNELVHQAPEHFFYSFAANVDPKHGFVLALRHNEYGALKTCHTLTLNQSGHWCTTGECNDACFIEP